MPIFNKRWGCRLNELKSSIKHRKPNSVKDAASLSSLVNFLNTSVGAVVPPGAVKAAPITEQPTQRLPAPSQAPPPATAPAATSALSKLFFTGRFKVGKDYVAEQAGLKVFSIAEPLYFLQQYFFGTADKTLPGAREFLQRVGQWGRGEVSAQYPLTPERASFIHLIRSIRADFPESLGVSWALFGADPELWLQAMLVRADTFLAANPGARAAVVNVRFQNEYQRLSSEGWVPFHVMASPQTWAARLAKSRLTPESPEVKDASEQLAASLDQNVTKTLSQQRQGNKLRAIWSDDKVPSPSPRLLTVVEFVAMFPKV